MSEPEEPHVDRLAVQRLRRRIDGFARGLGIDAETAQQIAEQVVADLPSGPDEQRLMEARKRLLIATE